MSTSYVRMDKSLLANQRISVTAKLLLAQLLDHRNKQTGMCNPARQKLAEELGVNIHAVKRALRELYAAGLIHSEQGQRTNFYTIQVAHIAPPERSGGAPARHQVAQYAPPGAARPYSSEPNLNEPAAGAAGAAAAEGPTQPPPQRRPPAREESTLLRVGESLEELARRLHMPLPDEDLVRRVVEAARGAPCENICATLGALYKRGRFGSMRSWGLVPILIAACFEQERAHG